MQSTVLTLIEGDEAYGVATAACSAVTGLQAEGYEVIVLAAREGRLVHELQLLGCRTIIIGKGPPPELNGSIGRKAVQTFRLQRWERAAYAALKDQSLHESRPIGIHVIWPNLIGLAGLLADLLAVPAVWEMPNVIPPRWANRFAFQFLLVRSGVRAVAACQAAADSLGRWPRAASVRPWGVNPEHRVFGASPVTRRSLGITPEDVVFGFVARLAPSKGQAHFVRALGQLEAAWRERVVVLQIGSGSEASRNEFAQCADESGVRCLDVGYQQQVKNWLTVPDVIVNLHRTPEAFGLSVVESAFAGRPALVYALGGPKETVIHGATGWHITEYGLADIARATEQCLEDRDRWPAMGAAAKARAQRYYSHVSHAAGLLKDFRSS